MKKMLCLLVIIFIVVPVVAAAESSVGKLYDAAVDLAFNTHNVTLSAEAIFKYDSETIKVMHASYKQDGTRSYLSYMLDTPQLDGSMYTGGYTVYGNGNTAYSCDTYWGNYYNTSYIKESDTVLSLNNHTKAALSVGRKLALSAADGIVEKTGDNKVTFEVGDLPKLIDSAVYYIVADYLQDNNYSVIFNSNNGTDDSGISVYYEDYNAIVSQKYRALFDCDIPDMTGAESSDDINQSRYNLACSAVDQLAEELLQKYKNGVVYVLKDGNAVHYETSEEYMRANGQVVIEYWDENKALQNYYKSICGEELSQDLIEIITYSPNIELRDAYISLKNQMDQYYKDLARRQDPNCVSVKVKPDLSLKTYDSLSQSLRTPTQQILAELSFAELKSLNAVVTSDAQERLSTFEGHTVIEVTAKNNSVHYLEIDFSCKAENYGETHVPASFVPADYGLVSLEEFNARNDQLTQSDEEGSQFHRIIHNSPATITFMGKSYQTLMEQYKSNE